MRQAVCHIKAWRRQECSFYLVTPQNDCKWGAISTLKTWACFLRPFVPGRGSEVCWGQGYISSFAFPLFGPLFPALAHQESRLHDLSVLPNSVVWGFFFNSRMPTGWDNDLERAFLRKKRAGKGGLRPQGDVGVGSSLPHPQNRKSTQTKTPVCLFIVALFTTAKSGNNCECSLGMNE